MGIVGISERSEAHGVLLETNGHIFGAVEVARHLTEIPECVSLTQICSKLSFLYIQKVAFSR